MVFATTIQPDANHDKKAPLFDDTTAQQIVRDGAARREADSPAARLFAQIKSYNDGLKERLLHDASLDDRTVIEIRTAYRSGKKFLDELEADFQSALIQLYRESKLDSVFVRFIEHLEELEAEPEQPKPPISNPFGPPPPPASKSQAPSTP